MKKYIIAVEGRKIVYRLQSIGIIHSLTVTEGRHAERVVFEDSDSVADALFRLAYENEVLPGNLKDVIEDWFTAKQIVI